MHHYQRGRASITGLMAELRKIIETGRLVVVVMARLVLLGEFYLWGEYLEYGALVKKNAATA
jgi:hypothetical protein